MRFRVVEYLDFEDEKVLYGIQAGSDDRKVWKNMASHGRVKLWALCYDAQAYVRVLDALAAESGCGPPKRGARKRESIDEMTRRAIGGVRP